MKKGFVSIFTLMTLLILSLTITFLYVQNQNTVSYINDLYNKKQAQYIAESALNLYIEEYSDEVKNILINDSMKYENKEQTSHYIGDKQKVTYNNKTYDVKISYVNRIDKIDLTDIYMISIPHVRVGESIGTSNVYLELIESTDGSTIEMKPIIKNTT